MRDVQVAHNFSEDSATVTLSLVNAQLLVQCRMRTRQRLQKPVKEHCHNGKWYQQAEAQIANQITLTMMAMAPRELSSVAEQETGDVPCP